MDDICSLAIAAFNEVFVFLRRFSFKVREQALDPELELFYWKDSHHREVDFVLKKGLKAHSLIRANPRPNTICEISVPFLARLTPTHNCTRVGVRRRPGVRLVLEWLIRLSTPAEPFSLPMLYGAG